MKLLHMILVASCFALVLSCRYPDKYVPIPALQGPEIYGLEILLPADKIAAGETMAAQAMAILSNGRKMTLQAEEVYWESLNSEVVLVDSQGVVTGVGAGNAEILIRMGEGGLTAVCPISVERAVDYGRLLISEVLCDPAGTDEGREYIEIYNDNEYDCDVSGMQIVDGNSKSTAFVFPEGSLLGAKNYAVIAQTEAGFLSLFEFKPDYSGFGFSLNNTGETVLLLKRDGAVVDMVYIKGGSSEMPAPELWGSDTLPSAASGDSVSRVNSNDTDTCADWESGPPSPGY